MRTTAGQDTTLEVDHVREAGDDPVHSSFTASTAFVHLWLLLMIVGAVGVLIVSIPRPVYEAALAIADPSTAGWWAS